MTNAVKPTVVIGLSTVAVCVVTFGFADRAWELFAARFVQGLAGAFSWTGVLAWLIAAAPSDRRGTLIGTAFAAAVGGTLFGPVLGGVASLAGTRLSLPDSAKTLATLLILRSATELPQGWFAPASYSRFPLFTV